MDDGSAASQAPRPRSRGQRDSLTQESASTVSPERGEGLIDERVHEVNNNDFFTAIANPVPALPHKPQLPPKPVKPTSKALKGEVELPRPSAGVGG
jgi:hypothetical protein